MSTSLEPRVSEIETALKELAYAQLRTERSVEELSTKVDRLSDEMREFKNEMHTFKDETRRESKEMNRRWGDLANRLGTLVEDIVAPNIPGVLSRHFGVEEPDYLMVRVRRKHPTQPDRRREFDVIAITPETLFINETKSNLRREDITTFHANYAQVREFFPEYADRTIVPIMSSLYISSELVTLLSEHHIYAMAMNDEVMSILNADEVGSKR